VTLDETIAQLRADARDFLGGRRVGRVLRAISSRIDRVAQRFDGAGERDLRIPTRLRAEMRTRVESLAARVGVHTAEVWGCIEEWWPNYATDTEAEAVESVFGMARWRAEIQRYPSQRSRWN
jgi:hypothetical protein